MTGRISMLSIVLALLMLPDGPAAPAVQSLAYAPAPADNPLKGLVPYAGEKSRWFPHSMEFSYLPLSALVKDEDRYDWEALENLLDEVSRRGHQTIFRIYLEYPGRENAIPQYLIRKGLRIHRWERDGGKTNLTPDYADPNLRKCLRNFIAAMGARYDGDPRIGFITAGLLGMWGEWHTYPRTDLWADKRVQEEILEAYGSAFSVTPVLLRYPAGKDDPVQAENATRRFGYHDDSFAWATLESNRPNETWFFLTRMKAAGPRAMDKWEHYPIGGEIRPEAWGRVFDAEPDDTRIQDFAECVRRTHVTWLMDSGLFSEETWSADRRKRAEKLVQRMGYEFYVRSVAWDRKDTALEVAVEVENRGTAPFYYAWPIEFALLSDDGVMAAVTARGRLTGLLPGDEPVVWRGRLDTSGIAPGSYYLAVRIANPLPQGIPLRFANRTQDRHRPGWLTLTPVSW